MNGANAYNENVHFLVSLPFVFFLEWFLIRLPIAYHAGYSFYLRHRGGVECPRVPVGWQLDVYDAVLDGGIKVL